MSSERFEPKVKVSSFLFVSTEVLTQRLGELDALPLSPSVLRAMKAIKAELDLRSKPGPRRVPWSDEVPF